MAKMVVTILLGIVMTNVVEGVVVGKKDLLDRQGSYHSAFFIKERDNENDDAIVVTAHEDSAEVNNVTEDDANKNRTECRLEYRTVETVYYSEVMTTECRSQNVTTCNTVQYEECGDQEREECHMTLRQECQDRLEEECFTQYRTQQSKESVRECDKDCQYRWEGTGGDKRWVVDHSTCHCQDITRDTVAKVPFLNCTLVTRRECKNIPVRECQKVKEKICQPKEKEECKDIPHKECKNIHKKVPQTIRRNIPVQVCKEGEKREKRTGRQENWEQLTVVREPRGIYEN